MPKMERQDTIILIWMMNFWLKCFVSHVWSCPIRGEKQHNPLRIHVQPQHELEVAQSMILKSQLNGDIAFQETILHSFHVWRN